MEELKQTIILYWPKILEYACMILAYVLVFLYRSKVKGSHNSVTALFREQTQENIKSNEQLQKDVHLELAASKKAYQEAIDKIAGLEQKVERLEKALLAITTEEVRYDNELCENEGD